MSPRRKRCGVFISYNRADADFAGQLAIELYRNGLEVWFDRWGEIKAGDSLSDVVAQGLKKSNLFIFILSPASLSAPWPQDELRAALSRRRSDKEFRVIPVVRKNCRIPMFLQDYRRIDARPPRRYSSVAEDIIGAAAKLGYSTLSIPGVVRERRHVLSPVSILSVRLDMRFSKSRGRTTSVAETHTIVSRNAVFGIRRRIAAAGQLSNLSVKPGALTADQLHPGTTLVLFTFFRDASKAEPFVYTFSYTLKNTFNNDEEYWYYDIQSPMKRLSACLAFHEPVKALKCYRRQGEVEKFVKTLRARRENGIFKYRLDLPHPPYLESVVFRWKW